MPVAERKEAEKEAGLLSTLDHPNITAFWESFVERPTATRRTGGAHTQQSHLHTRSHSQHCTQPAIMHPCLNKGKLCIVMEYADGGDLEKLLKGRGGSLLPESQVVALLIQICLALKHIHDRKVDHTLTHRHARLPVCPPARPPTRTHARQSKISTGGRCCIGTSNHKTSSS